MENNYQYLVTRNRYGKTRYFFNNGGIPRHEIPLGEDRDLAIKEWKTLIKNRKETVFSKRAAIAAARSSIVPATATRRSTNVRISDAAPQTLRPQTTWAPTQNSLPFIPRPLSEIYVNYVPRKVVTPFDLKAWNKNRISVMNPLHPNFR